MAPWLSALNDDGSGQDDVDNDNNDDDVGDNDDDDNYGNYDDVLKIS